MVSPHSCDRLSGHCFAKAPVAQQLDTCDMSSCNVFSQRLPCDGPRCSPALMDSSPWNLGAALLGLISRCSIHSICPLFDRDAISIDFAPGSYYHFCSWFDLKRFWVPCFGCDWCQEDKTATDPLSWWSHTSFDFLRTTWLTLWLVSSVYSFSSMRSLSLVLLVIEKGRLTLDDVQDWDFSICIFTVQSHD